MSTLDPDEILFFPGSLISSTGEVVAPYDLESGDPVQGEYCAAACHSRVRNANSKPFRLDWEAASTVHVLNGMGVTLGDSIVGLTAIAAIKRQFPNICIRLYRPGRAPQYVEALYSLAAGVVVDECVRLPCALDRIPPGEPIVDVGNHLFWTRFAQEPMIDFFLDALGIEPTAIPSSHKRNGWLQTLPQAPGRSPGHPAAYALFSPAASTPLRAIPTPYWTRLVDSIDRAYGLPVLGFGRVEHPAYTDISDASRTTADFIGWVRDAAFVMTGDSAALHVAAGFDVPTTAFFSSVGPGLRARDYPLCDSIAIDVPSLRGLQASSRDADLRVLDRAFQRLLSRGLPLPSLPSRPRPA